LPTKQFEKEYLKALVVGAKETVDLYSNKNRSNREKMIARAFLRCAGVKFSESELSVGPEEPVDISFRSARFQIKQLLGQRKPGAVARERLQRYQAAKSIGDVMDPWKSSEPQSFLELSREVTKSLSGYATKYGIKGAANLDALVHVALSDRHLYPPHFKLDPVTADALQRQGWRSVSIVAIPYSSVLVAVDDCPKFLRDKVGQICEKWKRPSGWFDPQPET
jgi:hypothetical protein